MRFTGLILAAGLAALTLACKESPSEPGAPHARQVRMVAKNAVTSGTVQNAPVMIVANSGDLVGPLYTDELGQTEIITVYQDDEPVQFAVSVRSFAAPTGTVFRSFSESVKVARVWDPRAQTYIYTGDLYLVPLG